MSLLQPILFNENINFYQNINNDKIFIKNIINYFLEKIIKWSDNYNFKIFNFKIIKKLLKKLIKKYNYNWYDLRTIKYKSTKKFLIKKLKN